MTARLAFLVALACLASCGPAPIDPPSDLLVTRRGVPDRVLFGEPFEVVVERTWPAGASVAPFDPAELTPLVVDRSEVERRSDDRHERETWTLRARALELGALEVPATTLRIDEEDGPPRSARAEADALTVVSDLSPEDDGAAELPSDVLDLPAPLLPRSLAVVAVLVAAALLLRRREPAPTAARAPSRRPPALRARLEALRGREPSTRDEWDAFGADVADVVREAVAADASDTSEEVAAGVPEAGHALATCDEVKFGEGRPDRGRRERLVDRALDVVERSR